MPESDRCHSVSSVCTLRFYTNDDVLTEPVFLTNLEGKVGKVSRVGKIGRVGKVGKEGTILLWKFGKSLIWMQKFKFI